MEACRRMSGWWLLLFVAIFVFYARFAYWFPGILHARGISWSKMAVHLYIDPSSLLGTPLSIAATTVVAFILFGQVLYATGGGQFFTDLSMIVMGRFRRAAPKPSHNDHRKIREKLAAARRVKNLAEKNEGNHGSGRNGKRRAQKRAGINVEVHGHFGPGDSSGVENAGKPIGEAGVKNKNSHEEHEPPSTHPPAGLHDKEERQRPERDLFGRQLPDLV